MLDEPVALPVDLDAAMSLRTVDDDAVSHSMVRAIRSRGFARVLPQANNTWIPVSVDQVPAETAGRSGVSDNATHDGAFTGYGSRLALGCFGLGRRPLQRGIGE